MVSISDDKLKTMDISFCDKIATNIVLSDAKQAIVDSLNSLIKESRFNGKSGYKYANIINKNSIQYISKQPHIITIKTGGSNYFIYLTKINGINNCLFIDRKIKSGYTLPRIISVNYNFDDSLFMGTILDGELVRDTSNNWMFLISNLISYKGKPVNNNFISKINLTYKMLGNEYNEHPEQDICYLRVKKIFTYNDYDSLILRYIPKCKYEIKGIYFNTMNNKHSNHLFMFPNKNKINKQKSLEPSKQSAPAECLKILFVIKPTEQPDIYNLQCLKDSTITNYSIAYISKLKISKLIKEWFSDTENTNKNCIVNCKYNTRFNKWEVLSIEDKNMPSEWDFIKNLEN